MQPGQAITQSFDLEHLPPHSRLRFLTYGGPSIDGSALRQGDRYCVQYAYPAQGNIAEFGVVAPVLEHLAKVRVHGAPAADEPPSGELHDEEQYAAALVVAAFGKHIVCLPVQKLFASNRALAKADRPLGSVDVGRELGEYRRIAESDVPIESLRITADDEDNITVSWTPAGGAPQSVRKAHDEWQLPPKPAPKEEPDAGKDEK
jgi:hypothetical protein